MTHITTDAAVSRFFSTHRSMLRLSGYSYLHLAHLAVLLLCALGWAASASAEYKPLSKEQMRAITYSSTRFVGSLGGKWERSYDGVTWDVAVLPYSDTEGKKIRFRRNIRIDDDMLQRYVWNMYFLGVSDETELYINSQYVGRYFGGMTPFYVRIPERLIKSGANLVELVVSPPAIINQRHLFAQKLYSGVVRDILLVGVPHIWTNDVRLQMAFNGQYSSCDIAMSSSVSSGAVERLAGFSSDSTPAAILKKVPVTVIADIRRTGSAVAAATSEQQLIVERDRSVGVKFAMRIAAPELWSPENPALYYLRIRIVAGGQTIDEFESQIGLRDIRIDRAADSSRLLVNGMARSLKGIEYTEHYGDNGVTLSADELERDVQHFKTLGINLVRVRYSLVHPYFLDLCNRYGVFVLLDLPAYDLPHQFIASDETVVRMTNIAQRIVAAFDKDPAFAGIGIADGIQENTPEFVAYQRTILKTIRPLTDKLLYKTVRFGATEMLTDGFDFVCLRSDSRWQPGVSFRPEAKRMTALAGGRPVMVTFGKMVQPNNLHGYTDPLSVESQAQYLRDCYREIEAMNLAGSIIWAYNDYRTARHVLSTNASDPFLCTSGVVDMQREPRLSYSMLKALLNDEKEPLLKAGQHGEDSPFIFIGVGLSLGIVFLLLLSRFRRFREYIFRALLRPFNFYADIRDQRLLSTLHTVVLGVIIAGTVGLTASTIFYFFRSDVRAEYLVITLLQSNNLSGIIHPVLWSPALSMAVFSASVFVVFGVVAVLLRIASMFLPEKIYFTDTLAIAIWCALPAILLLPVSVGLYKLLSLYPSLGWLELLLSAMLFWCSYRTLKAAAVVFDIRPIFVYATGAMVLIVVGTGAAIFWLARTGASPYLEYFRMVIAV